MFVLGASDTCYHLRGGVLPGRGEHRHQPGGQPTVACRCQGHQKGTTLTAGMKQHLLTWRGRRAGTASAVHRAPQASGVAGRWFVCAPLCCGQRTWPLLPAAVAVGLAMCHLTHRLEQNEKVHLRPRAGRESPRRVVSIAACDSHPLLRRCSSPRLNSYVAAQGVTASQRCLRCASNISGVEMCCWH